MQTFQEYVIEEGKFGKLAAMGALAASSVFGTAPNTAAFGGFVDDWSDYYQTFGSSSKPALQAKAKENEARATAVLNAGYTVPADGKEAIAIAAAIFDGDDGHSAAELKDYLEKTGAVESGYRTKVQGNDGPARSYWQVEPKTAMSLVKNSHQYFGSKFHKAFGEDALKRLQDYDEKAWSDILETNDALGATMAAAKWISTSW